MIRDLSELATCEYILYGGVIYKQLMRGYRNVDGDETTFLENYALFSITFSTLESFLSYGISQLHNQLIFSETSNWDEWILKVHNVIKITPTCKIKILEKKNV